MPDIQVHGLPGIRAPRTATHRPILLTGAYTFLAQGRVIDGSKARDPLNTGDLDTLTAGVVMGKITSSSKYAPSIMGVTTVAVAIGDTTITVGAATAVELNRRIGSSGTFKLTGPPAASGVVATETITYSAVNTTTGVITCTATVNAFVAGSFVRPTDGSEVPLSFIPDGYGLKVTDIDGTSVDTEFPQVPVAGVLDASQLRNWPSDTSLQAWLTSQLSHSSGGKFVFDSIY